MNEDDAKKFILARRSRFIAAAIASVSMACGESSKPPPCLSPMPDNRDGSSEGEPPLVPPMPCLSPVPTPPTDASDAPDAGSDTTAPDAAPPPPMPCLSVAPKRKDAGPPPQPPPPRPCLSPALPNKP